MWGHPKGLFILFFTEMWERFSYYGMRAILVLYLVAQTSDGGLGWTNTEALQLYGWYTMLVYLMSVPGGILADRYIGQKHAVMLGGFLLVAGHSLMAYTAMWAFYTALALIVLGVGLLKPNISTMVGGLYSYGDKRRDSAFTIFYIGINIGAFLSSLLVGYVAERIGWHYGFGLAGIGMLLGQIVFVWGQKHLKEVGNLSLEHHKKSRSSAKPLTPIERDRIKLIFISFGIVVVFWAAFEQAGGLLNLYADQITNRNIFGWEMPASWFQALNPIFILAFGGVFASVWMILARRNKEPSAIYKMGLGTAIMGLGFALMIGASLEAQLSTNSMSSLWWLVGAYWFHTMGELCLSPIALAFITKVSPQRLVASMMGAYFAATGIANMLAAQLGALSESLGDLSVFTIITVVSVGLGLLLMKSSRRLNRLEHADKDSLQPTEDKIVA
jgi:POT family proton-dependent oligopeptide transporter